MKTRDIDDLPILRHLNKPPLDGCSWFTLFPSEHMPCVADAMPPGTPRKLVISKMKSLIRRGLVDGCACGCRGGFTLTAEGERMMWRELYVKYTRAATQQEFSAKVCRSLQEYL